MKIKEIKLYGFKSFCDEIKIALNPGITAFVGPNGSGKSNIFDALRWVFGEQSMKALRCERIEDLIYESTDAKHDAKFTEISVTVDNEDYFTQFGSEFEIKRRYYRTGESEFYLNRVKCRLQDIQALFLNSGTLTYSFLELAEIEKIIHGDTKEMFDDVSGILKYQERREQTRRRLEATEQDLLRLEDIIAEMQRGLRSLRRQVRQARLYHELKEEYNTLSRYLLKNEYQQSQQELADLQARIDEQEKQRQAVLQAIKGLEQEREAMKSEMAQLESKKKESLDQITGINSAIEKLQGAIEDKDQEVSRIALSCERVLTSIAEKEEIMKNLGQRRQELDRLKNEILGKIEAAGLNLENERKQLEDINKKYFAQNAALEQKQNILAEATKELQARRSELAQIQFEMNNKETLRQRVSEEGNVLRQNLDAKRHVNQDMNKELGKILETQDEAAARLNQLNERLAGLQARLAELTTDLQQRQTMVTEAKIIVDTLSRRLQEKGENKDIEKRFGKRIRGLVRNSIEVAPGYESIIDVCLGDLLDFYLLEDFQGSDFVDLPEGRFGFINTRASAKNPVRPTGIQELPAVGRFVKFPTDQKVLENYINNYFLIDDLEKAYGLSQDYPEFGFVTAKGILFRSGMIICETGEFGYFKISQGLEQHRKELEALQNEVLFTQEDKKRLGAEIDEVTKTIDDLKNQIFTINVKKSEHSLRLNEVTKEIEKGQHEAEALKQEQARISGEIDGLNKQAEALNGSLADIEKSIGAEEEEKSKILEAITRLQEEIDEHDAVINEMTLESVVLEERKGSLERTIEQATADYQRIESEIARLRQDADAKNLDEIKDQIAALKDELEAKKKEKATWESYIPENRLRDFNQRQEIIYDQLTAKQKHHEEIQNTTMQLKYQQFQLNHKKDEMVRKAREEFNCDLPEYIPEEIVEPAARLAEVKGKLERLGEINPLSLELFENEKKRLDEFFSQRDDIITAKNNLLKSIEELDQRAQERFVDIFQSVKKEFNFVFSNFFEGGEADLILTDQANPLTSRVEIVVRMAGKRLKTISQLSGGQRTLLAVSLLLAFYLVKPAPFCILDEIDAPLDDANVVRFNKFLRKLSQHTQVIIITHNRATMEYTDYLYGVTMEKPRQSKVISARLADLEKIGVE